MRLTDLLIRSLKAPKAGQKTFFDDALPGFGLRVSQGGAKSFIVMYGKARRLRTIGRYPEVALADARKKAKQVHGELLSLPPGGAIVTFVDARKRFLDDSRARTKPSTIDEYQRLLHKHFSLLKPLAAVSRQDIMEIVTGLRDKASLEQHAFVAIRTMMNWCVRHGLLESSPVPPLRFKTVSRTRILTDEELKAVWHRAVETGYPFGIIVQLLILTGQRRGEIAGLRRSWIKGDEIVFPQGFAKNKREHRMPIGPLAKKLIEELPQNTDLLFPSRLSHESLFNGWSKCKRVFDAPLGIPEYTLHDLRRTYSSNLAKLGVPIHVTERLLNHVSGTVSGIAAVYNRHTYSDEMRKAVQTSENFVVGLA